MFIFRTIAKEYKWVSVKSLDIGFQTPFSRLKRNWLSVHQASTLDTSKKIHNWSPEGDVLTLITAHSEPVTIHLNKLGPAVKLLFEELLSLLSQLFPSAVTFPQPRDLKDLFDCIGNPVSFVDNDVFRKTISPIYAEFEKGMKSSKETVHKIWIKGKVNPLQFKKWLKLEQEALSKILLILLLTGGGVSPRTFSIASLQYKQSDSARRNLYLHGGILCFAWPKAKGNSKSPGGVSNSLYAFPPQLNWPLFVYLGVIRKFTVDVMKGLNRTTGGLDSSLFVYTWGNNSGKNWEGGHINSCLKSFSQPLFEAGLMVPDLRQITQAIYCQHFQRRGDMSNIVEETVNKMGNHSLEVALRYYAVSPAKDPKLSPDVISHCVACSRAWHCWLGLISYDEMVEQTLGSLPILQRQQNVAVAHLRAENWLLKNKEFQFSTDIGKFFENSLSQVRPVISIKLKILTIFH